MLEFKVRLNGGLNEKRTLTNLDNKIFLCKTIDSNNCNINNDENYLSHNIDKNYLLHNIDEIKFYKNNYSYNNDTNYDNKNIFNINIKNNKYNNRKKIK